MTLSGQEKVTGDPAVLKKAKEKQAYGTPAVISSEILFVKYFLLRKKLCLKIYNNTMLF